jgi:hypothetical protein
LAADGRAVYGSCLIIGIAGLNPAESIDVRLLCLLCVVGSGLGDELITFSEESYRVCLNVCDLETLNEAT